MVRHVFRQHLEIYGAAALYRVPVMTPMARYDME